MSLESRGIPHSWSSITENLQPKTTEMKTVATYFPKIFSNGFPSLCSWERDLLGGQQMATLRGEAVISAKT